MTKVEILNQKYNDLHNVISNEDISGNLYKKIKKIIQNKIDSIPKGAKIGFTPYCNDLIKFFNVFSFSDFDVVGIFDRGKYSKFENDIPIYKRDQMDNYDLDYVFVLSFNFHEDISKEIITNKRFETIDIYNLLKENDTEIYGLFNDYSAKRDEVLNYFWKKFENTDVENEKKNLENLILALIEFWDFANLEKYCNRYEEKYDFIKEVQKKYLELMDFIKTELKNRKQKDIIMYWIDALPFDWLDKLPNIKNLSKDSLFFENAYTSTPYTDRTTYNIHSGFLPLDNIQDCQKDIKEGSKLLRTLEKHGYSFYSVRTDMLYYGMEYYEYTGSPYTNLNLMIKRAVEILLTDEKPVFLCVHVDEIHPFTVSPFLEKIDYSVEWPQLLPQVNETCRYVDECLFKFQNLLDDKIQIFMSDHGNYTRNKLGQAWLEIMIHSVFFVKGLKIKENRKELFNFKKFVDFVKWILDGAKKEEIEDIFSEYILMQDTEIATHKAISEFYQANKIKNALAYRGAFDGKYKYCINSIGEEFFYKVEDGFEVEIDKNENIEKFNDLKQKSGDYFPNTADFKRYRDTQKVYEYLGIDYSKLKKEM